MTRSRQREGAVGADRPSTLPTPMPSWIYLVLAMALMPLVTIRVFGREVVERLRRPASWDKAFLRSLRSWNGLVPAWLEAEAEGRMADHDA